MDGDGNGDRGLFSHHHHANQYAYNQVQQYQPQEHHQAKLSHELIGGAAAFAAMTAYEHKMANEGKPVSHAHAKQALAALAGFEVDRLAETKGMDAYQKHQAKQHAEQQAMQMYDAKYQPDQYQGGQNVPSYGGYGGPPQGGFMGPSYGGGGGGGGYQGGGGYGGSQGGSYQGGGGYGGPPQGGGYQGGGYGAGQGGGYGGPPGGGYGGPPGGYPGGGQGQGYNSY